MCLPSSSIVVQRRHKIDACSPKSIIQRVARELSTAQAREASGCIQLAARDAEDAKESFCPAKARESRVIIINNKIGIISNTNILCIDV